MKDYRADTHKNAACLGAMTLEHGEGWSRAIGWELVMGLHLASLLLLARLFGFGVSIFQPNWATPHPW